MAASIDELIRTAAGLHNGGRPDDAIAWWQRALAIDPACAVALNGLGLSLTGRDMNRAIECWRSAAAADPQYAEPWHNLCVALERRGRLDESAAAGQKAVQLAPRNAAAHNALGAALKRQGRMAEAIECYRRAIAINPAFHQAHGNLVFAYHYLPEYDPAFIFRQHLEWANQHAATPPPRVASCPLPVDRGAPQPPVINHKPRISVAYVSPDFREHSVACFIEPVLACHDRSAFDITCYSDVAKPDATTQRLAGYARWRDCSRAGDEALLAQIRADGIDVLVDLAGHTARNRLAVFARRAAPVQVSWIGYPNTTGLPTMDWRVTDALADPPGQADSLHSEKLLRLGPPFLCYAPDRRACDVGPLPARAGAGVTFGSLNNLAKLCPLVIETWARILRAVPGSRLLLKAAGLADPGTGGRIRQAFSIRGIDPARLVLRGFVGAYAEHLAAYHDVDIALDPFPYNGTTTTCEAMWMGVPVVTLAGRAHVGRVGLTLLTAVGLQDQVAGTVDEYVSKACELAASVDQLAVLRGNLRQRMRSSPLCDGARLTRKWEAVLRQIVSHAAEPAAQP